MAALYLAYIAVPQNIYIGAFKSIILLCEHVSIHELYRQYTTSIQVVYE